MTALDRRRLLRLAATAALLPTLASVPGRAAAVGPFAPPAQPMLYRRRLRRTMADGSAFEVSRSFSVRFLPAPPGYHVEGEQVDVSVEVPSASLASPNWSAAAARKRSFRWRLTRAASYPGPRRP